MASSNTGTFILIGAAGAAVWYFFYYLPAQPATPAASTSAPPATPAAKPAATPPATPPANTLTGQNTLASIFAAMVKLATAANPTAATIGLGADQWNYYLMQADPSITAPDPMSAFSAVSGFVRAQTMSAAQYWNYVSPLIAKTYGLSGLGLYQGLGRAMAWRVR